MHNSHSRKRSTEQQRIGGDIQSRVDLRQLVTVFLDPLYAGGECFTFSLPFFDPDYPEYHVYRNYYRNPATGDRGGAIKFVIKLRGCPYSHAVAFLEGWLCALAVNRD